MNKAEEQYKKALDDIDDLLQAAVLRHRKGMGRVAVWVDAVQRVGAGCEQQAHDIGLVAVDGEMQGLVFIVGGGILRRQLRRHREDFDDGIQVALFGRPTEFRYGMPACGLSHNVHPFCRSVS